MAKNFTPHRIAFYIGIVVVWQVVAMAGIWPDNIFPSPYEVAEDLFYGGADGSLFYGIATSMWRLVYWISYCNCWWNCFREFLWQELK